MTQGSFQSVSRKFQGNVKGVSKVSRVFRVRLKDVSRVFDRRLKGVCWKFHGCFKKVLSNFKFKMCFKVVSQTF